MSTGDALRVDEHALVADGMAELEDLSILFFDREMRIRAIHGGAAARHGYIRERVIGRRAPDVVPASAWEQIGPLYTRALTGETVTVRQAAADGTAVYETTFQPVRRDGELIGGMATSRDVTHQEELDRQSGMWQLAFDRTTVGVAVIQPDTHTMLKVNEAFARMHGGRPEDFEGRHLGSTFAPEERGRIAGISARAHATGYVAYTADHVRLDGSRFPTETEAIAANDEQGRLVYRLGYFRDVSAQREVEELQRRWELVFRTVGRGVAWIDPQTDCFIQVNPAAARMHGGRPEDYAGRPLASVFAPGSRAKLAEVAARLEQQGTAVYESEHVRADGSTFPVRAEVFTARDDAERVLYRLAFLDDLTDVLAREDAERRATARFELSFERAPVGMLMLQAGRILRANGTLAAWLGVTADELAGADPVAFVHPDEQELARAAVARLSEGVEQAPQQWRILTADGRELRLDLRHSVLPPDGEAPTVLVHCLDRTAELAAHSRLADLQARTETILDNAPLNIFSRDMEGRWLLANRGVRDALGVTAEELIGATLQDTYDAETAARFTVEDAEVIAAGRTVELDITYPDAAHGGEDRHFWVQKFPVLDADGRPIGLGGVALDVTERERTQRELAAARERFAVAFEHAPIGKAISRIDRDGLEAVLTACNPAFATMLGRRAEALVGAAPRDLIHPDDQPERDRVMRSALAGRPSTAEVRMARADGHWVWVLLSPAVLTDAEGEAEIVVQAVDITERKHFEQQLRHLADHDALTGLVNRRRFADELDREVARVRRHGGPGCLLVIDLDGFKYVNDAFGHTAGDDLLGLLGRALGAQLREGDVLGRIGGDEFAVLLPVTDEAGGRHVAAKLIRAVRDHGRITRGGTRVAVTASVGLTCLEGADTLDGEELIVEADIAMYQAKDGGKNQIVRYDRAGLHREQINRRTGWVSRLRDATRDGAFELHAQPIVPLDGTRREHYELLLRMREGGRLLYPTSFLYHAESDGLIVDVDRWVLAQAVALLADAQQAGRQLRLSVNLSGRTIQDPRIAHDVAALLRDRPVAPRSLTVEITETVAITNVARAAELAHELRELGCRVALDDFGAGFASFYYLKHLVFDELKIDGEFIERLPSSPTDQLIVRAVVDVARGLGADVVAERVQDHATVALLRELGVGHGQGFFLGRPAPLPPG